MVHRAPMERGSYDPDFFADARPGEPGTTSVFRGAPRARAPARAAAVRRRVPYRRLPARCRRIAGRTRPRAGAALLAADLVHGVRRAAIAARAARRRPPVQARRPGVNVGATPVRRVGVLADLGRRAGLRSPSETPF